jgi:hypothetical protein
MEVLAPEPLLMLWTFLAIVHLIELIIALLQINKANFKDGNGRLIWFLIVYFLPLAGSVLYFSIGKRTQVNFK